MSILLCCLSVSNHNRPKSVVYSPKNETPANQEVNKSETPNKIHLHFHYSSSYS